MANKRLKLKRDIRKLIRVGNFTAVFNRLRMARSLSSHYDTITILELKYVQERRKLIIGEINITVYNAFVVEISKGILSILDQD
jgi:hypothetical protein